MKKIFFAATLIGVLVATHAQTAKASGRVSFSIGVPSPIYYSPAYCAPSYPAYCPSPVYLRPAPVVVYPAPVYVRPAPRAYFSYGYGYGGHHYRPHYSRHCW